MLLGGGPCGCRQPFVIHSISNLKNPTIPILNVKNPTILISNLKNPTISISTVKNPTISEPVLELYLLNLDLITVQNRLYNFLKTEPKSTILSCIHLTMIKLKSLLKQAVNQAVSFDQLIPYLSFMNFTMVN